MIWLEWLAVFCAVALLLFLALRIDAWLWRVSEPRRRRREIDKSLAAYERSKR